MGRAGLMKFARLGLPKQIIRNCNSKRLREGQQEVINEGPQDRINIRILQTILSGIPFVLGLRNPPTWGPYVYVFFWAPTVAIKLPLLAPLAGCHGGGVGNNVCNLGMLAKDTGTLQGLGGGMVQKYFE